MSNVINYVIGQRNAYDTDTIEPAGGGKDYSQKDTIARNNRNWRSEYYSDDAEDDIIGAFPYDNIAKPIVLLEKRSTDFDIKSVDIEPKNQTREARVSSLIAKKAFDRYARKYNLASVFDKITFTRSKQGGVLVQKGAEIPEVCDWENLITDQMDIMQGIKIKRHYYTPAELKKVGAEKGWKNIDDAIATAEEWREVDMESDADKNKTQGVFIEVYEMHGEIPLNKYLEDKHEFDEAEGEPDTDDDDEKKFQPTVAILTAHSLGDDQREDGHILFIEEDDEDNFLYSARNPQVGRGLGESVYESIRENQKWHNYSKTEEARMMAIAGKMVYITNEPNSVTNLHTGKVDHGTVLKLGTDAEGRPNFFQQLNQVPQGTPVYQNMREEWMASARSITSAHPAKMGEEAKAGTPFRAQYLQNYEASSQFIEYRKEIGNDIIQPMVEKWILPKAIKEILKEDDLYTSFTPQELALIDDVITQRELIKAQVKSLLEGKPVMQEDQDMLKDEVNQMLQKEGNKRTIKKIKKFIKEVQGNVVINVTDEHRNKAVLFESYANILNTLAPEDPRRNAVVDKIMDHIGVTKEEWQLYATQAVPTQLNPQMELEEQKKLQDPAKRALPN